MAKKIDITDKLNFEENPIIVVKGKELEVNTDASNVLKILALADGEKSGAALEEMADALFTEKSRKTLNSLKLKMNDYSKVIEAAIGLAVGEDEGE